MAADIKIVLPVLWVSLLWYFRSDLSGFSLLFERVRSKILPGLCGHIIGRFVERIRPFVKKVDQEKYNQDAEDGKSYAGYST